MLGAGKSVDPCWGLRGGGPMLGAVKKSVDPGT